VIVHGWTDARISWPTCRNAEGKGRPGILVEEELARAIRHESALALMHWGGASQRVAWCWRKAIGAERFNAGSARLQRMNSELGAEANRGVPLSPEQVERRRRTAVELGLKPTGGVGVGKAWTEEEMPLLGTMPDEDLARQLGRTLSSVVQRRNREGRRRQDKAAPWTPEEDALLHTLSPASAALRTGRTLQAVHKRRSFLGLPRLPPGRKPGGG
jgi:hypothetical protein